ncbi:hypothetical protein B9Z19DRAFT_1068723 [Tuber borchii]|uniref:Uncharacterized protein n=1 Tax=Tuber borchii TaxID=42251 RepID=A0A2T6ZE62_TUBBO|nr:hypothetical protein B9Z19DRAFT_1068723 [Tuber borchii]
MVESSPSAGNSPGTLTIYNNTPDAPRSSDNTEFSSHSSENIFEKMSELISEANRWKFTSPGRLAFRMNVKIRKCRETDTSCYVLVQGAGEGMVDRIEEAFMHYGIRSLVRFTYEYDVEALIIKCVIGVPHARISRSFIQKVTKEIDGIPGHSEFSYRHTGDGELRVLGKRSKQADEGIAPAGTRDAETAWPTLVIEVGDSQSLAGLHRDAEWWLVHSKGLTRMVILIKLTKPPSPLNLHLEQWIMMKDESKTETRTRKPKKPGRALYWDINAAGKVTHHKKHPNLTIPYLTIFDVGHANATDIVISAAYMKQWALHVFKGLNPQ